MQNFQYYQGIRKLLNMQLHNCNVIPLKYPILYTVFQYETEVLHLMLTKHVSSSKSFNSNN